MLSLQCDYVDDLIVDTIQWTREQFPLILLMGRRSCGVKGTFLQCLLLHNQVLLRLLPPNVFS